MIEDSFSRIARLRAGVTAIENIWPMGKVGCGARRKMVMQRLRLRGAIRAWAAAARKWVLCGLNGFESLEGQDTDRTPAFFSFGSSSGVVVIW